MGKGVLDMTYNVGKDNPMHGKHHSAETIQKIRLSKLGDRNPNWFGDDVGYSGVHLYIKKCLPKPELCDLCKVKPAMDLANKSGRYLRDIEDWQWLCRKCHMISDGRIKNLRRGGLTSFKNGHKYFPGRWD